MHIFSFFNFIYYESHCITLHRDASHALIHLYNTLSYGQTVVYSTFGLFLVLCSYHDAVLCLYQHI